tara:strand:- start:62 stop:289 length:228 start_codon:yes stop_codon:yes gene_type:complete
MSNTKTYTKDNVTYEVDKFSTEGQSIFNVLVAAKKKVEEASLELALARASVLTLVSNLDKELNDEKIFKDDVGHP